MSALLYLMLACGGAGDDTGAVADTGGFCADAPVVTWETWGQGFLMEACQPCHASTTPNRQGAPADVVFDTYADAWQHRDRILARATGAAPTMPPSGGVQDEDRQRLEIWLRCGMEEP